MDQKMTQEITSAATSINQVPAILKLICKFNRRFLVETNDVLDYGGGRYDKLTDLLAKHGIRNWVYDPYNRSKEHNEFVRQMLTARQADVAVCSNVLNVIREPSIRQEILKDIKRLTRPGGYVFFTVYEGDRSSRGKKTPRGWQANRPTKSYLREVRKIFPYSHLKGKLIYAKAVP